MKEVLNEKITLVSVSASIFSGYRRATREHIAALGGLLPESAAITEGSIKVFPCEGTKALHTVRRNIVRKLQARGVRALGSQSVYAVLTDDLPEIEKEIAQAKSDFMNEVKGLDASYEALFEAHVQANQEAEAIIRSLKVDRAAAVSRCRFGSDVFKIAPQLREGQSEEEGVEGIVRGLGRQLYEEFAASMDKLLRNDAFVRQRVGQKTLRPLKAELAKLKRLAFLEPTAEGAVKLVTDILQALPQEGYIEGQNFVTLERLVETMSDADTLLNAASRVKNGIAPCDVLFQPPPQPQQAAGVVAEPVAPLAVPAAHEDGRQTVMLPPIPASLIPGANTSQISGVTQGRQLPPLPVRPAPSATPALRSREDLKTNALMF